MYYIYVLDLYFTIMSEKNIFFSNRPKTLEKKI